MTASRGPADRPFAGRARLSAASGDAERLGAGRGVARSGVAMATSPATRRSARPMPSTSRRSIRARIGAGERRDHRRLQPGLLRRDDGARQGRRCGDAADALVLQSQDDARHARRSRRCRCPAARENGFVPDVDEARAAARRSRARHRARHAEQSDRRRLSARDHRAPSRRSAPSAASRSSSTRPIAISSPAGWPPHALFAGARLVRHSSSSSTASRRPTAFPAIASARWSRTRRSSPRSPRSSTRCRSARRACRSSCSPWAIAALADWRAENRAEIAAAAAAFERGDRCARRLVDRLDRRLFRLCGASLHRPRAMRRSAPGWRRERGVLCLPGSYFGPAQEGFLRVAFANANAEEIGQIPARLSDRSSEAWAQRLSSRHARTDPGIHSVPPRTSAATEWIAGSSPAMATEVEQPSLGSQGRWISNENLKRLRAEYGEAAAATRCATRNSGRSPTRSSTRSGTRVAPYAGIPTFLAAPLRAIDWSAPDFGDLAGGVPSACRWISASPTATARASARARCAPSSASAPTTTCSKRAPIFDLRLADIGDVPFRSRFSLEIPRTRISSAHIRMIVEAGVAPLSVGGDHSMTLPILRAVGRKDRPGRHGPYRRALRHVRALRHDEVPPRRPVPPGGARRRARSRSAPCRSASAARPNIFGSSPTIPA